MLTPIIGLEIHIELKTKSKLFCSCPNDPNERHPNVNICPICLGHPGGLPVINREAIKKTIKTGLALNCQIPEYSKFERRIYFYPDLPKGFQISQREQPLSQGGFLKIKEKKIRIKEIHLEEDVGRLIHEKDYSLIDFNRAGIPLMELTTEPDLNSAKEARKFAQELQLIVRYLGVSDADMEKGEMRCDANISLTKAKKHAPYRNEVSGAGFGTKVEIKNLNSFKAIERGIDYEIERQSKVLKSGKKIISETRGWNEVKEVTVFQREKKEAIFSPEPDLPRLHLGVADYLNEIEAEIPELPQQRRQRFAKEYKLDEKSIEIFVQNKDFGEYFEKVMSELINWVKKIEIKRRVERKEFLKLTKLCSNYLITDLQGLLKGAPHQYIGGGLITPENFVEFLTLIYKGKISSKIAKEVLKEMFLTRVNPSQIIEEKGLVQITNEAEIEKIIKEVISKNKKAVGDFKSGKERTFQYLIGQIMAKTGGKANPQIVNKILKQLLTKMK